MNFNVHFNGNYRELIVESNNAKIESSILNEAEAAEIARDMIIAAEELLSDDYGDMKEILNNIANSF